MDKDNDKNDSEPNPSDDKENEPNANDNDKLNEGQSLPPMPSTSHTVHAQCTSLTALVTPSYFQPQKTRYRSTVSSPEHLCDEVKMLRLKKQALISENATLKAQYSLVVSEMRDMKWKQITQNHKTAKKRKLNVNARCLTSEEGLRLVWEQEAEREAQEQEKNERVISKDKLKRLNGGASETQRIQMKHFRDH